MSSEPWKSQPVEEGRIGITKKRMVGSIRVWKPASTEWHVIRDKRRVSG
jgi:hypothetical protein